MINTTNSSSETINQSPGPSTPPHLLTPYILVVLHLRTRKCALLDLHMRYLYPSAAESIQFSHKYALLDLHMHLKLFVV